jgi:hypothetical protein
MAKISPISYIKQQKFDSLNIYTTSFQYMMDPSNVSDDMMDPSNVSDDMMDTSNVSNDMMDPSNVSDDILTTLLSQSSTLLHHQEPMK